MAFAELKPVEKAYWVAAKLPAILASLPGPAPTVVVSRLVADALGCTPDEVGGTLLKMAYDHPQAHQDGPTFKRYGRTMRRWRWIPTDSAPSALAHAPVEAPSAGRSPELKALVEEFMRDCGCSEEVALPFAVEELEARGAAAGDWSVTA